MVKCAICGKELNSEAGLIQHHKVKHPDEPMPESSHSKDEKREEDDQERAPKKRGGMRRNLELRKRRRRAIILGVAVALLAGTGIGVYGLYNITAHPSAPYGSYPFPCAGSETVHLHPYLSIVIDGSNVTIPADIGTSGCHEPLHTHDTSGIIHVEAPANTQYTLAGFFEVWRATYGTLSFNGTSHPITFNSTDILGFRADATHKVVLLVDGKPSIDYGSLVLNSLDYCSAATTGPPCSPTAAGDPSYGDQAYPFGTGHTIVIQYIRSG